MEGPRNSEGSVKLKLTPVFFMKNILNRNIGAALLTVACGLGLSNCGALFNGSKDVVNFTSEPAGAHIFVDGMDMGKTPAQLALEVKRDHTVEYRLNGYDSRTHLVTKSAGTTWIVLDILGGVLPIVVDAATGAWNNLDESNVNMTLEKK